MKNYVEERDDESTQQVECCKVPAIADHVAHKDRIKECVLPTRQTDVSGRGPDVEREEVGG